MQSPQSPQAPPSPTKAGKAPTPGTGDLRSLDLLRGASAQIVLMGHATSLLLLKGSWPADDEPVLRVFWKLLSALSGHGFDAVIVFFVLSGILVGKPLRKTIAEKRFHLGTYLLKRASRMYVVVLPGLLFTGFLIYASFEWGTGSQTIVANNPWYPSNWPVAQSMSADTLACNALFLQSIACPQYAHNTSLWSLSNEMLYYLLFPALLLLFNTSSFGKRLAATGAIVIIICLWMTPGARGDRDRVLLFYLGFAVWLLGAYSSDIQRVVMPRAGILKYLVPAVLGVAGIVAVLKGGFYFKILGVIAVVLVFLRAQSTVEFWVRRSGILERSIKTVSEYSFSLYVLHVPLMFTWISFSPALLRKFPRTWFTLGAFLSILFALNIASFIFYKMFESRYSKVYGVLSRSLFPPKVARAR